jgi:hypothetical protein
MKERTMAIEVYTRGSAIEVIKASLKVRWHKWWNDEQASEVDEWLQTAPEDTLRWALLEHADIPSGARVVITSDVQEPKVSSASRLRPKMLSVHKCSTLR